MMTPFGLALKIGHYSNNTAWNLVRNTKQKDEFVQNLWHKSILFKISFLAWRLCKGKLSFNEVVSGFENHSNAECYCCNDPAIDSIQHIFT